MQVKSVFLNYSYYISKTITNGPVNGQLVQGDISTSKLEGLMKGIQISNMTRLIEDNNAYVKVHTK